jgi:polyisoprenoid-binding protein YceI
MMNHRAVLIAAAIALILAHGSVAAEQILILSPEQTEVSFSLAATGENVLGSLQLTAGEIHFDEATGAASGRVEIDARAAKTGNRKRDAKMHKKVLESDRFAMIRFTPESIEGALAPAGPSDITLHGMVTILGHDHPLDLAARVEADDGGHLRIQGDVEVPYVAWGLHDPSVLILRVAKVVNVSIAAEGVLSGGDVDARQATGQ